MAQVKPALTLDVSVGSSSHAGVGGSSTSMTPRAHQNAVNQKALAQMQASAYAPQTSYERADHQTAYVADSSLENEADTQDNSGFSSDDDDRQQASFTDNNGAQNQYQRSQRTRGTQEDDQASLSSTEVDEYGRDVQGYHDKDDNPDDLMYEEGSEEEEELDDDESEVSSSPSIPDENIDFDLVYALHNFVATVEGQATVHKGNSLTLLDDSNSYWWLVRVLRTQEVGYIPAENIETPFERLARLNKHRNVDITSATQDDHLQVPEKIFTSHLVKARNAAGDAGVSTHSGKLSALSHRAHGAPAQSGKDPRRAKRGVVFGPPTYLEHSGDEYSDYDEEDEDEMMEYEQDPDAVYEEDDDDYDEEAEYEQEPDLEHLAPNGARGMEPDDGMDWDEHETERIQQQHEAANAAAAQSRSLHESAAQQADSHPSLQQTSPAAFVDQDVSQSNDLSDNPVSMQESVPQTQPRTTSGNYAPAQARPQSRDQFRTLSDDRPLSNASNVSHSAANESVSISRNSTTSNSSFLPSQIQRERASSDASATSSLVNPIEPSSQMLSPEKDKRKSNRSSKGSESLESTDEKVGKKRSSVFSLFSRKDKKDRKSIISEDRDSIVGRSSNDSFAGPERSASTNPTIVMPEVQAANAGLAPGQSIGMGRAVQERDRAQQEAYQRQFLSAQNTSPQPGDWSQSSERRKSPRPGSLVGPSGSTPMLSVLRVFAGDGVESESTFKTVLLNESTRSTDLQRQALQRFGVPLHDLDKYVLTIKRLEGDERPLDEDEHPLQLFNNLTHILQEGQVTVPSVKRSSVGSISSISSNLSTHPAIARLGNDFSDDHAVKFYISRRDRLNGYVDLSGSNAGDDSAQSTTTSDVSGSQDTSGATMLSFAGQDPARSSRSSVMSADSSDTVQSPTARFSLRLVIFASDLPESTVFDPQSNALIPSAALKERLQRTDSTQSTTQQQHQYREKILTFPRNTTVAEVVEEGLDRFGIAEGIVEGGDDVEDRPSRRKGRLHVKYGLVVRSVAGDRALHATSRILEAYETPPNFKLGVNKRRSIDAAALLGASNDIGPNDPVFVLRQISNPQKIKPEGLAARTLSPTGTVLAAKRRSSNSPAVSPRLGDSRQLGRPNATDADGHSRQDIIAAQRAAAAERNAAVLGSRGNEEQGIDVMLSNKGRIRSSKLGMSNKYRYSYMQADGRERDISSVVEQVFNDPTSIDSDYSRGTGLQPQDVAGDNGRPVMKNRMQSDMTIDDYASARSSSRGNSPLSLNEVHFDLRATPQDVAPLSYNKQRQGVTVGEPRSDSDMEGDLLAKLVRNDGQSSVNGVDGRLNAVLSRIQSPSTTGDASTSTTRAGSRATSASPAMTSTTAKVGAGAAILGVGALAVGAGATALGAGAVALAAGAAKLSAGDPPSQTQQKVTSSSGSRSAATNAATNNSRDTTPTPQSPGSTAGTRPLYNSNKGAFKSESLDTGLLPMSARTRGESPHMSSSMVFGADDQSLSHLYTIVDAAARRDPRKQRLTKHGSISSITSASPVISSPTAGMNSRPGSKLSTFSALMDDDRDALKAEASGLFAPNMPFIEDKKVREAYSGISRELGTIDDGLDQLLADIVRIF